MSVSLPLPDVKKVNVFWAVISGFFDSIFTSILIIISVIGTGIIYVAHGLVVWILSGLPLKTPNTSSSLILNVVIWILMYIPILVGSVALRLRGKSLSYLLLESFVETFGSKTQKEEEGKPSS